MSCRTIRRRKREIPNNIAVNELYLSHLSDVDHKDIRISSVEEGYEDENKIPLELDHSGNFGLLQLSFRGPEFHDYFPLHSTVKIKEILLKKSKTIHKSFDDGDWEIIHIITEKISDCNYLFEKAIEDSYTVILAIQFEIFNGNNASRQLTFYPRGVNGTPLHRAVAEKDIKVIETLLRWNLDINARNGAGWTPLLVAVDLEMPEVVDFLINKGADVNAQNNLDQTPLHYAAKRNNSKIINSLIKNRAELNKKDKINGHSSLHYAVDAGNVSAVDILLKNGADYILTNSRVYTLFHLVAARLNLDIIEIFLNNHIDANILNSDGQTPLFFLSKKLIYSQREAVDKETYLRIIHAFVQKGANVNFQDSKDDTPLHYAVVKDNIKLVQALLECNADVNIQNKCGKNVLHWACQYEKKKCIQVLLDFNIDINAVDIEGKTALHLALESEFKPIIKLLLNNKADVNLIDALGKTALHLALESRYITLEIVESILSSTSDINAVDVERKTALHVAAERRNCNAVELILNKNPNINMFDTYGKTALHLALESGFVSIIVLLLNNKADVNIKHPSGKTALHLALERRNITLEIVESIVNSTSDINAVDVKRKTALHVACFTKNTEVVKYLLINGADSNIKDNDGRTVFHYTCMKDNAEKEHFRDILNILVEENISINCVDIFGKTPLHYAAESYSLFKKINELLLNVGADINIEDKNHNLAFDKSIELTYISIGRTIEPHIKHIIKMKVMKLWVQEKFLDKIYKVNNRSLLKCIQDYEGVCNKEIDLMKNTNLEQSNTTYYDFWKKSPHDAVNYTRNQSLVNAIKSDGLITMFPIYGHFLKNHLREAQRRSNLYEKIQESLDSSIFEMLPTSCMNEILRYLNNSELNILLEALRPVVSVK